MADYPKHIKRKLRELAGQAYENELAKELAGLAAKFDEWRAGKISAGELSYLVHKYEIGPSRQLYSAYNDNQLHEALIASAIVRGFLKEEEIPADVMPYLQSALAFFRQHIEADAEVDDGDPTPGDG